MKKINFKIFFILLSIALLSASCWGTPRDGTSTKIYEKAQQTLQPTQTVTYEGESGKIALQILKEKYTVQTKEFSGVGEFVQSIGGIQPDSKHFWAFYVNGQSSNVGAGSYATKNGDTIEWKMEAIK